MNKTCIGFLVAAALCGLSATALAQQDEGAGEAPSGKGAQGEAAAADGEAAASAEGEAAAGQDAELAVDDQQALNGAEGGLKAICEIDPEACPKIDMKEEAKKPLNPEMYAVQQIYALRVRRFELNPYWGYTLNDQFVSHPGPGLAINYYIWNTFAVGLNGNYYRPLNVDSAFNRHVRRAARVGVPLNEYDWSAALNLSYVPVYGKFAGFQDFIFHWDAYVVLGGGLISTRPIPVFDPDYRNFEYKPKPAGNVGLGLRIFINRWFAAMLEVRDYIYNEELESLTVAPTVADRQNDSTWLGDSKLTNHVQLQAGVSVFLPFSFEYRLPK